MSNESNKFNQSSFVEDAVIATFSATLGKTVPAPIERIKLLISNQDEWIKIGKLKEPFTGITDCFVKSSQIDGITSMWRGNTSNLIRYLPPMVLNFSIKDQLRRTLYNNNNNNNNNNSSLSLSPSFASNILCGAIAGGILLSFLYSLDVAQTHFAKDKKQYLIHKGERKYNNLLDIYKKEGVPALYKGFQISLLGVMVYRGLYFGLYDSLYPSFVSPLERFYIIPTISSFFLAWSVTVVAGLGSYPVDTIRRRMLMTSVSGEAQKYKSSFACLVSILQKEGYKSLFKGAGANVLRAISGSIALTTYHRLHVLLYGNY